MEMNECATLPAKLNALPSSWVDRIFGRMEALYGATFIDKWRNTDIGLVKSVWSDELTSFSDNPECFGRALKELMDVHKTFPPSLPEFVDLCRKNYEAPKSNLALAAPDLTQEQTDARRDKAAAIAEKLRTFAPNTDWAKKLRTRYLGGERLLPVQIDMASSVLGETWSMNATEITERAAA